MAGFTSNPRGTRWALVALVLGMVALGYCSMRDAQAEEGLFAAVSHSSTGGATAVNAGRNLALLGWETPTGLSVGMGRFLVGSASCANAVAIEQHWARWTASLQTYGNGRCERNGREIEFTGNVGVCGTRVERWRRYSIGFGACLWHRADVAVHDLPLDAPENREVQLTASIVLRANLWERRR